MGAFKAFCAVVITEAVMLCGFAEPCGLTAEQLESGLRYDLKPLAQTFVEIEEEYGINSAMYASMVALESGWGRSKLSESKNNITSFTCNGKYKAYDSKEDCLWDMARNLSENYLDEEGAYYNGGTELEDISCFYLVGKSREELSEEEEKRVNKYVETIEGIYEGIIERSGVLTDSLN